ncbi:hypothetical protein BCR33DRAFT_839228 [Rhizoclosmatium globosum]|uniref:Uncharacterized protein n=1 Tax=Rhizoclosmatium globosum TaxID=329046 RepID=A0A1Y2CTW3_9FUNG|nr:hypothetical protein BCR33DRAFT_839228 [Rhizoclosmatium globosum]|eukprot:ORY50407.1 hypothetical protein BCR33DRAFT_839228 [Rhizoclosmatium globosum]
MYTAVRSFVSRPEAVEIMKVPSPIGASPTPSLTFFERTLSLVGLVKKSRHESVVSELETAIITILQVTERFTEQHNKTTDYSNSLQIKFDALSAKYSALDSHSAELETTNQELIRICRDTAAAHNQEIENQETKRLQLFQEHSRTVTAIALHHETLLSEVTTEFQAKLTAQYNVAANQTNSLQTNFDALSAKYYALDSHSAELEKANQDLIGICRDTAAAHNQEIENQENTRLELAQEHSRTVAAIALHEALLAKVTTEFHTKIDEIRAISATENAAALEASEYAITSKLDKYYQDQLADKDKEYRRLESEMNQLNESCASQVKSLSEAHTVKVTTFEIEVQRLTRLPKTVKLTFDAEKQELRVMNKELTKGLAVATQKIDTLSKKLATHQTELLEYAKVLATNNALKEHNNELIKTYESTTDALATANSKNTVIEAELSDERKCSAANAETLSSLKIQLKKKALNFETAVDLLDKFHSNDVMKIQISRNRLLVKFQDLQDSLCADCQKIKN